MTTVNPDLLEQVLIEYVGRSAAEEIIVALDEATAKEADDTTDTAMGRRCVIPGTVENLADGDLFSLDQGMTWHSCASVGFGTVSVYTGTLRGDETPTVRLPAQRGQRCLVDIEWTRLHHFTGEYYARTGCPDCKGEGLVKVEPAEPSGSDTDTCRCVREADAVPERHFRVLVQETSQQWADVQARALNEADIEAEGVVQLGDGYGERFTGRSTVEIHLASEDRSDTSG